MLTPLQRLLTSILKCVLYSISVYLYGIYVCNLYSIYVYLYGIYVYLYGIYVYQTPDTETDFISVLCITVIVMHAEPSENQIHKFFFSVTLPLLLASITCSLLAVWRVLWFDRDQMMLRLPNG